MSFRIVAVVPDKHLSKLLRACVGITIGQPAVMPVADEGEADHTNGSKPPRKMKMKRGPYKKTGKHTKKHGAGRAPHIDQAKFFGMFSRTFSTSDVKHALGAQGRSTNSGAMSGVLKRAVDAGVIRKLSKSEYERVS
jgi:hypothetical protein